MCALPSMSVSPGAIDFIDDGALEKLLRQPQPDRSRVRDIVAKSLSKQALSVEETASLLAADEPEAVEEIFDAARQLKRDVYGNRIVIFAPLYIGNNCVNDCAYCSFNRSNHQQVRRTLADGEIRDQVREMERRGHKRIIVVFGEHPDYDARFIADCVRTVYDT